MTGPLSPAVPTLPGLRLQRRLGEGSYGAVYLAVQESLQREVAVKVLSDDGLDSTVTRRFVREARVMSELGHPHLIRLLGLDLEHKPPYLVMELLPGGTLRQRILAGHAGVELALPLARGLLEALRALHGAGVLHRDVKPSNIVYRTKSEPVLADLGLARPVDPNSTAITRTGFLVGSLPYMAPELFAAGEVDARADLFAAGVTIYEALIGDHPNGYRPFHLEFIAPDVARARPGCPRELAELVRVLLAGDKAGRPADAETALRLLEPRGRGRVQPAPDPRRKPRAAAAAAGIALSLALLAGVLARRAPPPAERATPLPVAAADPARQIFRVLGAVRGGAAPALLISGAPDTQVWRAGDARVQAASPAGVLLPIPPTGDEVLVVGERGDARCVQRVHLPDAFVRQKWKHLDRFGCMLRQGGSLDRERGDAVDELPGFLGEHGVGWICLAPANPQLSAALARRFHQNGVSTVFWLTTASDLPETKWNAALEAARGAPDGLILDARERTGAWRAQLGLTWPGLATWGPPAAIDAPPELAEPPDSLIILSSNDSDESWRRTRHALVSRYPGAEVARRVKWVLAATADQATAEIVSMSVVAIQADSMVRANALARAWCPESRFVMELMGLYTGGRIRDLAGWAEFFGAMRVLDDVTFTGRVARSGTDTPRLESGSNESVGLAYTGSGRQVYLVMTDGRHAAGRFVPRAPGVLWDASASQPHRWVARPDADAHGLALTGTRATAVYEEVVPVPVDVEVAQSPSSPMSPSLR